jgi:hypothetical protein
MLQKLYPSCVGAPLASTFKLIFLAEGFGSARPQFMAACADFYDWLLATPPFNVTRFSPAWLTVLAGFQNAGAASASGSAITASAAQVTTMIDGLGFRDGDRNPPVSEVLTKGERHWGTAGALIVLLLPDNGTGAQMEHLPASQNEYHFAAMTTDSHWQQLVLRVLAGLLGLQDEADGPATAPATAEDKLQLGFNSDYLPDGPASATRRKWRTLGANAATPVHAHSGTPAVATYPASPSDVEFWEGSGGFQTRVYRSASDCLMRRRLTDSSASLRARRIPLCLACRTALIWELAAR